MDSLPFLFFLLLLLLMITATLLTIFISQCIVESSNACFCYGEVLQIYHCLVRSQNIMATQQVCDNCPCNFDDLI